MPSFYVFWSCIVGKVAITEFKYFLSQKRFGFVKYRNKQRLINLSPISRNTIIFTISVMPSAGSIFFQWFYFLISHEFPKLLTELEVNIGRYLPRREAAR